MSKVENKQVDLIKEQKYEIIEGAGEFTKLEFSWSFPFIYRTRWVFGGFCGLCGQWNWQWTEDVAFCRATAPCKDCIERYGD